MYFLFVFINVRIFRPNPGVLFKKKNTSSKISLKNFVKDSRPGNVYNDKLKLFAITPDNAEKLHFILDE